MDWKNVLETLKVGGVILGLLGLSVLLFLMSTFRWNCGGF